MTTQRIVLEFARADNASDPYAFRIRPQEYLIRIECGGFRSTRLAWDDDFLYDLESIRTTRREPDLLQRLGNQVRRLIEPVEFARYEPIIAQAHEHNTPIYITIRSAAAELYALPWELLTVRTTGQHLGELPSALIRYEWPETRSVPPVEPRLDGERILVAWSDAGGAVPAREHEALIARACARGHVPFDRERDIRDNVTLEQLDDSLTAAADSGHPVSVLHLLAHGAGNSGTYGLALSRERGRRSFADAGRLRQILGQHASHLRLIVLCACDSANQGELGNHLGSIAQNLHAAGVQSVIASRYPLTVRGSIWFTDTLYHSLLVQPSSLEDAFLAGRRKLAQDSKSLDWASIQLYARASDGDDTRPVVFRPYRGLLPFRAEHARFFFGRTAERDAIISNMDALSDKGKPRLLVVAGASGTGKSSVVMAGALPAMTRLDHDPAEPSQDEDEERALERALRTLEFLHSRASTDAVRDTVLQLREALTRDRMALDAGACWEVVLMRLGSDPMEALSATLASRLHPARRFLLVIDQFEELFTSVTDPTARTAFARRLWTLCTEQTNVHCIVTIRVDFLGACGDLVLDDQGLRLDQVAYDEAHRVFVAQMAPDQLRAAIERPAHLVGLTLERGLASTMLADVGAEPGALPLLQYTLDQLWQRRIGSTLTMDSYHAIGGVTGALERKADALIDSFNADEQRQARRLLVRLVGVEHDVAQDTRRRAIIDQLRPVDADEQAAFDYVLGALVEARLLVRGDDGGKAIIEVAHEALIRKWERLRAWLGEDRDKLVELQEVERWVVQWRDYGTLLDGDQLGYAVRVRDKYRDDLDRAVLRMIETSVMHQAEIQRRARRRNRIIVATALAVTAVVSVLALYIHVQSREVQRALVEAERQEAIAKQERSEAEKQEAIARQKQREADENAKLARERAEEARRQRDIARRQTAAAEVARAEAEVQKARADIARIVAENQRARALREKFRAEDAEREERTARQAEEKAKLALKHANDALERENERLRQRNRNLHARTGGGILKDIPDSPALTRPETSP